MAKNEAVELGGKEREVLQKALAYYDAELQSLEKKTKEAGCSLSGIAEKRAGVKFGAIVLSQNEVVGHAPG